MLQIDTGQTLNLSIEDVVGQRIAILGISGSGKTNTSAVLAEELLTLLSMTIVVLANSDVFFVSGQTTFSKSTA